MARRRAGAGCVRSAAVALALGASLALTPASAQTPPVGAQGESVDLSERVTRATVVVMVGAFVRARGVVLGGDGRVVTALAPLRSDTAFTIRYADGRTDAATIVASDGTWGIALLQPRGAYWREGIAPAGRVRGNSPARWTAGPNPRSVAALFRRRRTFVGRGAELMRDALEFDPPPADDALGSGVANAAGGLIAIVVPPDPGVTSGGARVPFGVPAVAVQELTARAGNTARPFLGLTARELRAGEGGLGAAEGGLIVTRIAAGGPAARAGVRLGTAPDIVIGADGRPVRTPAELGAVLQAHHAGERIVLRIVRDGAEVDLAVDLEAALDQRL